MKDIKGPGPFTPEVLDIYYKVKRTTCPEERGELLLQLANHYASSYDPTNDCLPESFHAAVDSYHQHYLRYNQAGLKLGRVVLEVLQEHAPAEDTSTALSATTAN